MKIYKAAEGVPAGYVKIRVICSRNGNFSRQLLEHGPGTDCHLEDDEALMNDLLNTEITGFGKAGAVTDAGHTKEYFEGVKQPGAMVTDAPFPEQQQLEDEERTPDMGYGV